MCVHRRKHDNVKYLSIGKWVDELSMKGREKIDLKYWLKKKNDIYIYLCYGQVRRERQLTLINVHSIKASSSIDVCEGIVFAIYGFTNRKYIRYTCSRLSFSPSLTYTLLNLLLSLFLNYLSHKIIPSPATIQIVLTITGFIGCSKSWIISITLLIYLPIFLPLNF